MICALLLSGYLRITDFDWDTFVKNHIVADDPYEGQDEPTMNLPANDNKKPEDDERR